MVCQTQAVALKQNILLLSLSLLFALTVAAALESPAVWAHNEPFLNVADFGATGDNATDNTAAFGKALAAAAASRVGTVFVPPGLYCFHGSLVLPPGTTLRGSFSVVPSHDLRVHGAKATLAAGTTLIPLGGRGDADGPPFLHVQENAAVAGLVIYYGEQEVRETPVPYPWTVLMTGNNAAIFDVEVLGAWRAINATGSARHYIARVQGHPIAMGVYVDQTYDIGRIEDVHFNPWFSSEHPFIEYQLTAGIAFQFCRSDWEYVLNTFAFGYAVGYHFVESASGAMNGNLVGIGADLATNASILVEATQPAGLLITNGEFTAFHSKQWLPHATWESSHVVVGAHNTGPVKFVTTSFWGPCAQVAKLAGTGVTSFSSCEFVEWDEQTGDGRAAVQVDSGSVIVSGCGFRQSKHQIEIAAAARKAVVMGNMMNGPLNVTIRGDASRVQMGLNAHD